MTDKYYTPEIEEFYIGFEYEVQIPKMKSWSKETFYLNKSHIDLVKYVNIQDEHVENKIRVKYLDKADIEECGFELVEDTDFLVYELIIGKNYYTLIVGVENNIHLSKSKVDNGDDYMNLFNGFIKNKSELKQVLKMLKIS